MNRSKQREQRRETVQVQPTRDLGYCDAVARELWMENWFDGCRPPEGVTYRGAMGRPGHLFLRVRIEQKATKETKGWADGGLFRFEETAPGLWECHSQLLRSCRGALAIQAYELGLRFMFRKMKAQRLNGFAPGYQRQAVWFAVKMGFRITQKETKGTKRNGKEFGMTHYEMTRERYLALKRK